MPDRDDQIDRFIDDHPVLSFAALFTLALASIALALWLIPA